MQLIKQIKTTMVLIAAGLLGLRTIFGYIDPSSGGMLFQILAVVFGLLSGIIFFFSSRIKMGIARLMRKIRGEEAGLDVVDEGEEQ